MLAASKGIEPVVAAVSRRSPLSSILPSSVTRGRHARVVRPCFLAGEDWLPVPVFENGTYNFDFCL
jgi:hypothetical protein